MAVRILHPDRLKADSHPGWFHCTFYPPGFDYPNHAHAYAEVFWIERGRIRHRYNGHVEQLQEGDVRFIHPGTAHSLTADDGPGVVANLAFPVRALALLDGFARDLPFSRGAAPGFHIDPIDAPMLREWSGRLAHPGLQRTEMGAFVLWISAAYERSKQERTSTGPAWLAMAIKGLESPTLLAAGVPALARLAGRTTATLGRHIRRHHGCTTIQLINRLRLAWLALRLVDSDEDIAALAAACGLANLGHCYKLFRSAYGCAPGEYRVRASSDHQRV